MGSNELNIFCPSELPKSPNGLLRDFFIKMNAERTAILAFPSCYLFIPS